LGIPSKVNEARRQVVSYDGPDSVRIPFYRFFIDPYTPPCCLQKAAYMCEESVQSWDDFLKEAEYFGYDNVKYVEYQVKDKQNVEYQVKDKQNAEKRMGSGRQQGEQDSRSFEGDDYAGDVRKILYWDKQDVIVSALIPGARDSGGILLKRWAFEDRCPSGDFPYYAAFNHIHIDSGRESGADAEADEKPGGFYPPGDIRPIHGLQQVHNTTWNQRVDQVTLGLRNPILTQKGAILDIDKLADGWIQNPIMEYDNPMGRGVNELFYQVKFQDTFGSSWAEQEHRIKELVDDVSGTMEAIKGEGDPNNQTKGGYMQAATNAMRRISFKVYILTKLGLEPMLTAMSDMNCDLISSETLYYVFGDPTPLYINPEEVVRGLAYSIRTVPPYSKQLMAEAAVSVLPILEKYAPYAKTKRPIEMFLENQEWLENAEEIIPKNAPDLDFNQIKQLQIAMMAPPNPIGTNVPAQNRGNPPAIDIDAESRKDMR
jgi:hypothetical protein